MRSALRPALLARYRDLTALRYDFPLVLVAGGPRRGPRGGAFRHRRSPPERFGPERRRRAGDAARAAPRADSCGCCWPRASKGRFRHCGTWPRSASARVTTNRCATASAAPAPPSRSTARSSIAMPRCPSVCSPTRGAWCRTRRQRALRDIVARLTQKLSDILRADFDRSDAGRSPESLKASIGDLDDSTVRLRRDVAPPHQGRTGIGAAGIAPAADRSASGAPRVAAVPFRQRNGARREFAAHLRVRLVRQGARRLSRAAPATDGSRQGDCGGGTRDRRRISRGETWRILRRVWRRWPRTGGCRAVPRLPRVRERAARSMRPKCPRCRRYCPPACR